MNKTLKCIKIPKIIMFLSVMKVYLLKSIVWGAIKIFSSDFSDFERFYSLIQFKEKINVDIKKIY